MFHFRDVDAVVVRVRADSFDPDDSVLEIDGNHQADFRRR
jgi:hypothetical protein